MGIPLSRGRDFSSRDLYDAPPVAIISEALARDSFPSQDPIGQRLECGLDSVGKWMTIVGVVGAVRQRVRAMNPETAMKFTTMDAMVSGSIAKPRFRVFLISAFAGLALVLALVGVYGVMNFVITQRTSEFGLR